jgi:hypothetical protein
MMSYADPYYIFFKSCEIYIISVIFIVYDTMQYKIWQ